NNVGVVEGGRGTSLAHETLDRNPILDLACCQHLDGDPPSECRVLGKVNRPHASLADLISNYVRPDPKTAISPTHNQFGLKSRQYTPPDQPGRGLCGVSWQIRSVGKRSSQGIGGENATLSHQIDQFGGGRRGHEVCLNRYLGTLGRRVEPAVVGGFTVLQKE